MKQVLKDEYKVIQELNNGHKYYVYEGSKRFFSSREEAIKVLSRWAYSINVQIRIEGDSIKIINPTTKAYDVKSYKIYKRQVTEWEDA